MEKYGSFLFQDMPSLSSNSSLEEDACLLLFFVSAATSGGLDTPLESAATPGGLAIPWEEDLAATKTTGMVACGMIGCIDYWSDDHQEGLAVVGWGNFNLGSHS